MKKLIILSALAFSAAALTISAGKAPKTAPVAADTLTMDTASRYHFSDTLSTGSAHHYLLIDTLALDTAAKQLYLDTVPQKQDTVKKDTTSIPH